MVVQETTKATVAAILPLFHDVSHSLENRMQSTLRSCLAEVLTHGPLPSFAPNPPAPPAASQPTPSPAPHYLPFRSSPANSVVSINASRASPIGAFPSSSYPESTSSFGSFAPAFNDEPVLLEKPGPGKSLESFLSRALGTDTPSWTCEAQRVLVQWVLESWGSGIFVLPTGFGKSMGWTIAGLTEDNSFVFVVTPNRSLLEEQIHVAANVHKINTVHYVAAMDTVPHGTKIVFSALESAAADRFKTYAPLFFCPKSC